ncbi:MAG: hypothetical protein IIZ48_01075 [Erysipelotrichales bacterium]|nr:hypothetical protein [Erysipelotrichales bacterium]
MKKLLAVFMVLAVMLLAGCGSYTFTQVGTDITIKADAKDGDSGDTEYFTVGPGCKAVVTPSLTSGSLEIEYVDCVVWPGENPSDDDITKLDTVVSVTVSGNKVSEIPVPAGDYIIRVTAKGQTKGTVKCEIVHE